MRKSDIGCFVVDIAAGILIVVGCIFGGPLTSLFWVGVIILVIVGVPGAIIVVFRRRGGKDADGEKKPDK